MKVKLVGQVKDEELPKSTNNHQIGSKGKELKKEIRGLIWDFFKNNERRLYSFKSIWLGIGKKNDYFVRIILKDLVNTGVLKLVKHSRTRVYYQFEKDKDPLDELIISDNEAKLIKENNKLIARIKELEQLNEHIRAIYKRDLKKELKTIKKKHYWCDYCKKNNIAEELGTSCDECYYCEDCGHPKVWHDITMNSCFANGDNCGCWGYKPDKKKGLVKEKELKP